MTENTHTDADTLATLTEGDHFTATRLGGEWIVENVEENPRNCKAYVVAHRRGEEHVALGFRAKDSRTVAPEELVDGDAEELGIAMPADTGIVAEDGGEDEDDDTPTEADDEDAPELFTAATDSGSLEQILTETTEIFRTESGDPVRVVYESLQSGNEVEFEGHVVYTSDSKPVMTVERGDLTEDGSGRKISRGVVYSNTGPTERRVGSLVRIELARPQEVAESIESSIEEDEDDDSDDEDAKDCEGCGRTIPEGMFDYCSDCGCDEDDSDDDTARTIEEAKPFSEEARKFGEDVARAVEEARGDDEDDEEIMTDGGREADFVFDDAPIRELWFEWRREARPAEGDEIRVETTTDEWANPMTVTESRGDEIILETDRGTEYLLIAYSSPGHLEPNKPMLRTADGFDSKGVIRRAELFKNE